MNMVKKSLQKCLALALSFCMILTMMPVNAFAYGGTDELSITGGVEGEDFKESDDNTAITILTDKKMTVSGTTTKQRLVIGDNVEADLTFDNVDIKLTESSYSAVSLNGNANLNLTLKGVNKLTLMTDYNNRRAALHVSEDAGIVIGGTGSLSVINEEGCGIGSNSFDNNNNSGDVCGSITINSGSVEAVGRVVGGIGGYGAVIKINGGTVVAKSEFRTAIGGNGSSVHISGAETIVEATGGDAGIGYGEQDNVTYMPLDINISGGTVTASGTYVLIGGGKGRIHITGGTIKTIGRGAVIGGEMVTDITIKDASVNIEDGVIGGYFRGLDQEDKKISRNITIGGNAVITGNSSQLQMEGIGGGDNSDSTIVIKDNAVINGVGFIGSSGSGNNMTGYAGGTIKILDNASIYRRSGLIHYIGGSYGGDGGNITIDTTGTVNAKHIGGGDGDNGGDGGNIIIKNGNISVQHIGGGNGVNKDGTGIGGSGGNISISGGKIGDNHSLTGQYVGYGSNKYYYSAAGIGGGGGTLKGGNGGNINITGGKVSASAGITIYNTSTGETDANGDEYIGGAGIGGGNGASGGIINISGGTVETFASTEPYDAQIAEKLPALIGGGSAGGAGEITISGGNVNASLFHQNTRVYDGNSTTIGQGKGATDAGGFVKIIGGKVKAYEFKDDAKPNPWPTAAGGGNAYPVSIYFSKYTVEGFPKDLDLSDASIVSISLTDISTNQAYSYGVDDIVMTYSGDLWLPIPEAAQNWNLNDQYDVYNIEVKARTENTTYAFEGKINFSRNKKGSDFVSEYNGRTELIYKGEAIDTIELTSDFGDGSKAYNGADQKPNFTVKNTKKEVLEEGKDYSITIKTNIDGDYKAVTEMRNAGIYIVTASGKTGTDYDGMTATLDYLHINPKAITAVYNGEVGFTKEYDGTVDLMKDGKRIDSIPLSVNPEDILPGESLTNISVPYPRYSSKGIGTGILLDFNTATYDYEQNGQKLNHVWNYNILLPELKGDITLKVLGETNFDASKVVVAKTYDGTANCKLENISGEMRLKSLVGEEIATVKITAVSQFDSKDAGDNRNVTLTMGNLSGADAANYKIAEGKNTIVIKNAKIIPADYSYNLSPPQQAQEFTQGGGLKQIDLPQKAKGIGSEEVTGTVSLWHDEACTANKATDISVNALTVGEHKLYVKFVPDENQTNYTKKVTTGKVIVLTVLEGAAQEISFENEGTVKKVYGDDKFINLASNKSEGGGAITYESDNADVAVIDSSTGQVTVKGVGTATINATAKKVEGKYRTTTRSYTLVVDKKPVTVNVDNKERVFGTPNPKLTFTHNPSDLVGDDTLKDLAVSLYCTAIDASPAGTAVAITGISESTKYEVNIIAGQLTITKANAPLLEDIKKSLVYNQAHDDVEVRIIGLPADRGETSFEVVSVTDFAIIVTGSAIGTDTGIKFSTVAGEVTSSAAISVDITMQNYKNTSVNVIVKLVDKIPVTITGISIDDKVYDGAEAAYKGSPANAQGYTGDYEYIWSSGSAPKDKGSYTLIVRIPESSETHMGELELNFNITAKPMTVKPKDISIYNGEALPDKFDLEYVGIVDKDSIELVGAAPVFEIKKDGAKLENSNTNGTYTIEWANKDGISILHKNYTIVKADGTLTISSKPSGGGGSATPKPSVPETSDSVETTETTVKGITDEAGKTAGTADEKEISKLIDAVKNSADNVVTIILETTKDTKSASLTIPAGAISLLAENTDVLLKIDIGIAALTFDSKSLDFIINQISSGDVSIEINPVDKSVLPAEVQSLLGSRPLYDFAVKTSNGTIEEFGTGYAYVSIPYNLEHGEEADAIVVYYVKNDGTAEAVRSVYNSAAKSADFITSHFSKYGVGYNKLNFKDVFSKEWFYKAVTYTAARGITTGTSADTFSPDSAVTRGQFIVMLMRAYGIEPSINTKDNFADAGNTYYTDYLAKAKELGITTGTGSNMFEPEKEISRQDMFTMLYRALGELGQLPKLTSNKELSSFSDRVDISDYALDAMENLVQAGIISGSGDKLDPKAQSSRAQMVQVLYNLLSN